MIIEFFKIIIVFLICIIIYLIFMLYSFNITNDELHKIKQYDNKSNEIVYIKNKIKKIRGE